MTDAEVKEWAYWVGSIPLRQGKPLTPLEVLQDLWDHRTEDEMTGEDQDIVARAVYFLSKDDHDVLPASEI